MSRKVVPGAAKQQPCPEKDGNVVYQSDGGGVHLATVREKLLNLPDRKRGVTSLPPDGRMESSNNVEGPSWVTNTTASDEG